MGVGRWSGPSSKDRRCIGRGAPGEREEPLALNAREGEALARVRPPMRLWHLILRNAWRNKIRTLLTVLSIAVAVVVFELLFTINRAFSAGVELSRADRLATRHKASIVFWLPLSYVQRIAGVPGVQQVSWGNWFGGVYGERDQFAQFAIDPETYLAIYPEWRLPPEQQQAFMADRTGCIAGKYLADQYGWKIGDQIPLRGTIYPGLWKFTLRGIYTGRSTAEEAALMFQWKLLDEQVPENFRGRAGWFVEQIADPGQAAAVARRIDALFSNSAYETITETEKAFNQSFASMFGNVQLLTLIIGAAVVIAILMVAANTMAMVARERGRDVAILKTLGFPNRQVFFMILAESTLVALAGGAIGCLLGVWMIDTMSRVPMIANLLGGLNFNPLTALYALVICLLIGLFSGYVPGRRAARLSVVEALRRIT